MPIQTYGVPAQRLGVINGEMLGHAIPVEVLGMFGDQRKHPKNVGDTVVYRRWLPYGATSANSDSINRWVVDPLKHQLQEGVTPTPDRMTPQDIPCTLSEYGVLYGLTNRTADLSEDDVPEAMKKQSGERIGLVRELIRWGVLRGGTNAYYQGGSSRSAVTGAISASKLRLISQNLQNNHAKRITSILSPTPNYGTTSVEAAYVVVSHVNAENDIRNLPNFKVVADYGSRKPINENELGSWENFRFLTSPELGPYPDAGGAKGLMMSTSGTNADVYPLLVFGEDAWGTLALRGSGAIDSVYLPPGVRTKEDPLGQRGYVGASFYMSACRTNDGWMAVYECAVTLLT